MALTLSCVLCRKGGDASHFYSSIIVAKQIHSNNIIMICVGVLIWWSNEIPMDYIYKTVADGLLRSYSDWSVLKGQINCVRQVSFGLTSAGAKAHRSPRVAARAAPSEEGRSRITAAAPFCTSRSTVARPRPDAPPVTRPTIPCSTHTHTRTGTEQGEGGSAGNKKTIKTKEGINMGHWGRWVEGGGVSFHLSPLYQTSEREILETGWMKPKLPAQSWSTTCKKQTTACLWFRWTNPLNVLTC